MIGKLNCGEYIEIDGANPDHSFELFCRFVLGVKNSRAFLRPVAIATPSEAPAIINSLAISTALFRSFSG